MKFIFCIFVCIFIPGLYAQQKGYYRTPDIHKDKVAFSAEGDLWLYSLDTKETERLTKLQGIELNPVFSKDGSQIAFERQFAYSSEVFVLDINTKVLKRLTFDGLKASPVFWNSDKELVFRSQAKSRLPAFQLHTVNISTLKTVPIPLAQASDGTRAPDGSLLFTRNTFDGDLFKRYKGGAAKNIWHFNGSDEAVNLSSEYDGNSERPMIYKDRIFYLCDKGKKSNLWSMKKDGTDKKKLTNFSHWDIRSPRIYGSKIVYQKGADLFIYNLESNKEDLLEIALDSNFEHKAQTSKKVRLVDSLGGVDAHISKTGKYICFVHNGRIFYKLTKSVSKSGILKLIQSFGSKWNELSRKEGSSHKEVFIANDDTLVFLSDESGEYEIWSARIGGPPQRTQLSFNSSSSIEFMCPSKDFNGIAYVTVDRELFYLDLKTKETRKLDVCLYHEYESLCWSPDGRYITFGKPNKNGISQIWLYDIKTAKKEAVTSDRINSYIPQWSAKGDILYFLSNRTFPKTENQYGYDSQAKLYAMRVMRAAELSVLKNYIFPVPTEADDIINYKIIGNYIYWLELDGYDESQTNVYASKLDYREAQYGEFILSGSIIPYMNENMDKLLLINTDDKSYYITGANGKPLKENAGKKVSKLYHNVKPEEQWLRLFLDSWRTARDYFYDKSMHGLDWAKLKDKYIKLLPRITHKDELDDLISEMLAELSASHMYLFLRQKAVAEDSLGFLGADLSRSEEQGGFVVEKIYKHDPDFPEEMSPLWDLRISKGSVITELNGKPVLALNHIHKFLDTEEFVKLTIRNGRRSFVKTVKAQSSDQFASLRYMDWEISNRKKVEKSSTEIGYIHLRAMEQEDLISFQQQFSAIADKSGIIIDIRNNEGGSVSSDILKVLTSKVWMRDKTRVGKSVAYDKRFRGHLVLICNEKTFSDGEIFADSIQRFKLGTVIGTRTWGGTIGIEEKGLNDSRSRILIPYAGTHDLQGKWIIEGVGVKPDIFVENLPHSTFKGNDVQLDKAIDFLKKKIKEAPVNKVIEPVYPVK